MAEDEYLLSHTAEASERKRLGLIERLADPMSQRDLAALGIQHGWRCLEVGAGHGSVARWLAEQVGPQGRVVATDINPRFLTEIELPNVEVRRHDIRTDFWNPPHMTWCTAGTSWRTWQNPTWRSGAWWRRYASAGGSWSRT
jgi:SAM-dependent methyltransferase